MENLSFFQGVNPWFWFKNEKEQMLDQKNGSLQNVRNIEFFNRVNPWFLSKN